MNSSLTDIIFNKRVLRQGDPLSPLLFVLVIDCLDRFLDLAQQQQFLAPLGNQLVRHRASIYADDVIVFAKPAVEECTHVQKILAVFG